MMMADGLGGLQVYCGQWGLDEDVYVGVDMDKQDLTLEDQALNDKRAGYRAEFKRLMKEACDLDIEDGDIQLYAKHIWQ